MSPETFDALSSCHQLPCLPCLFGFSGARTLSRPLLAG